MGFSLLRVWAINTIIQKTNKQQQKMQNHACKYKEIIGEGFLPSKVVIQSLLWVIS